MIAKREMFKSHTCKASNFNHNFLLVATLPVIDRAGANYFRLVRPLRARKCEQARGVWGHVPPGNFFKIRHSEIASEAMFGPKKKTTRIVVSVPREAIEPNCQK